MSTDYMDFEPSLDEIDFDDSEYGQTSLDEVLGPEDPDEWVAWIDSLKADWE